MSLVRQVDATLAATIQDYLLQHPSDGLTHMSGGILLRRLGSGIILDDRLHNTVKRLVLHDDVFMQ